MRILLLGTAVCGDVQSQHATRAIFSGLGIGYRRLGHSVEIAWPRLPKSLAVLSLHCRDIAGIPIQRFGGDAPLGSLRKGLLSLPPLGPSLRRYDLVHLCVGAVALDSASLILLLSAFLSGVHPGVTFLSFRAWPSKRFAVRGLLRDLLLKRCRWVTALSESMRRDISKEVAGIAGKILVVPNGWDEPEIQTVVQGEAGPAHRAPYIYCLARMIPDKGIDVLLMAWANICGEFKEVELLIAGQDFCNGHLQNLAHRLGISGRVRFLGDTERAPALSVMRDALFFVLPSRREYFGKAALEAMALGKAVIATAEGPADFIDDGKDGLLLPPGNTGALENAMLQLFRDPDFRDALGKRAREKARNYTWEHVAQLYLAADLRARAVSGR